MPKEHIDAGFEISGSDCDDPTDAIISLIGSHLQNVCVDIESYSANVSVIMSPSGVRMMIEGLQKALAVLAEREPA